MNLTACADLPTTFATGTWYRAARLRHLPNVLRTQHTASIPSRFNPGSSGETPFEILYLADTHLVALFEVQALVGAPTQPGGTLSNPQHAWAIVNASVKLRSIVDLTDDLIVQPALGTSAQELTGDWRGYQLRGEQTPVPAPVGLAPTQMLGMALYRSCPDLEGFISLSARIPYHRILCIFPQRLSAASVVEFGYVDSAGLERTYSLP